MKRTGLRAKIVRVFALQVLIVSVATLIGIYLTYLIAFDVLARQALIGESEHFWALYAEDPARPAPNVDNMLGFLSQSPDRTDVPAVLAALDEGYEEVVFAGQSVLVHVSQRGDTRLFLLFDEGAVEDLTFYFGVLPLSLVLLLLYGLSFVTYRLSQRAISPIVRLANYLERYDFGGEGGLNLNLAPFRAGADSEVLAMIEAVEQFAGRLGSFIDRERTFTRDAGHELRTPLAILKGSLDLLEQSQAARSEAEVKALARMRRTVGDMESLLETLLLLAREQAVQAPAEPTLVNEIVADQLDALQPLADRARNTIRLHETGRLEVDAPDRVVAILIGNLVRNSINYTENGLVDVTVSDTGVRVQDTGVGMTAQDLENAFEPFFRADRSRGLTKGHGLGLTIVKRLARQFGWTITAQSQPGEGTAVEVRFLPAAPSRAAG